MRYFVFLLLISINAVSLSAKGRTSGSVTLRDSLVQYAKTLINTPYRSGSKGPSGFDCSGYTSYVYGKFGMSLNSSSGSQVTNGQEVDVDNLKKGDLVFFKGHNSKKSRIGHVGIFLDRNDDGSFNFIHSANGGGVRIDNSNSGYYAKRYVTGCSVITGKKLYKFDPVQVKSFSDYDNTVQYASTGTTHKVRKGESLYTIAQKYNVSEEQLKEWNNLNGNKIKPGQKLSIQSEKSIGTKNNVSAESKIALAKNGEKTHTVKKGESFYTIAKKYHISEEELIKANSDVEGKLKPGQKIRISTGGSNASSANNGAKQEEPATKTVASRQTHKVKKGETLSEIAEKYHTTSAQLKRLNGLSSNKLKPGTTLTVQIAEKEVPVKEAKTETASKPTKKEVVANEEEQASKTVTSRKSHKVRKGETLSEIADKYGVSVKQLKRWNGLSKNKVKPGTYLTVQMTEKEVPVKEAKAETASKPTKKEVVSNEEEQASKTVTSRKTHKVRKGETLSEIANKYGVSVKQLKHWNGISKNKVKPGTYLTVQMTEKQVTVAQPSKPEPEAKNNQPVEKEETAENTHVVAKGETLYSIAKSHHLSAIKLKEINNLSDNQVHEGDVLSLDSNTPAPKAKEVVTPIAENSQPATTPTKEQNVKPVVYTTQQSEKIDTLSTSYKVNKTHIVQDGETLESIAELYQVTPAQIRSWNGLSKKRSKVTPGQKLTIEATQKEYVLVTAKKKRPATKGKVNQEQQKAEEPNTESSTPSKPTETKYMVKKGETLFTIAKTTNLTVDQLKDYNHLTSTDVKENQILSLIPDSTVTATKKSDAKQQTTANNISYIVKPGDTLFSIAKIHNISVDELKAANEMVSGEVNIGQHLLIPVR